MSLNTKRPILDEGRRAGCLVSELRRLERDPHDGVQTELAALIVKLALAQEDPRTPPDLGRGTVLTISLPWPTRADDRP